MLYVLGSAQHNGADGADMRLCYKNCVCVKFVLSWRGSNVYKKFVTIS